MNVAEVQKLQQDIAIANDKLSQAKAIVESAKQKQDEILKANNVSSIEELQELVSSKESELNKMILAAKMYLAKVNPIIDEVNNKTNELL